jgi:hypothetical protein
VLQLRRPFRLLQNDGTANIRVTGSAVSETTAEKISVFINGESIPVIRTWETLTATIQIPSSVHSHTPVT